MTSTTTLTRQLRMILQLTQTEAQIARLRSAQARTEAVRRELSENGDNAVRRSRLITDQLRELGGVPDAVTPVIGRLTALLKSTVEQAEPFDEALFQDLMLEQQLLDRARYLKVLAEAAGKPSVRVLAEQLESAHSATLDQHRACRGSSRWAGGLAGYAAAACDGRSHQGRQHADARRPRGRQSRCGRRAGRRRQGTGNCRCPR